MKEGDALDLYCPVIAIASAMENIGKQYKPERRPLQTECIGRKCMMWVPFEKEGHGNCGLKRRP